MTPPRILALGAFVLLLYLAVPFGSRLFFPRVVVGFGTAVDGRVSGYMQSRHYHGYFLSGHAKNQYDFGAFVAAPAPGETPAETPAADPETTEEDGPDLNSYLKAGDHIRKPARSAELTVQRGRQLTRWVCPPAE